MVTMSHWQGFIWGIVVNEKVSIYLSSSMQDDITALMIAVHHGHSYIVEVLIRIKPDVNLQKKVGVVTYCSVCSACVSWAVTWCIQRPFVGQGDLIFWMH